MQRSLKHVYMNTLPGGKYHPLVNTVWRVLKLQAEKTVGRYEGCMGIY
jgi:hypothetical protein